MPGVLRQAFWLGTRELRGLVRDHGLLAFVVYAFTVYVATAGGGVSLELRRASIAIVDGDRSPMSRRLASSLLPPHFQPPVAVESREAVNGLDGGRYTFVLEIPAGFEARVKNGKAAELQLLVDATAVGQAYLGAQYIQEIAMREIGAGREITAAPVAAQVRVLYNPNRNARWHVSLAELLFVVTLLSIVLPAAAVLREREQGTLEHLLAMPLRPFEVVLGKIWPNTLVVLCGIAAAVSLVIRGAFGVPMRGSVALFFVGSLLYQFTAASLGIGLSTVTRTIPQMALLSLLVATPMMFLSGAWMPLEAMPALGEMLTRMSPLRYYSDFTYGLFIRGAGLRLLWRELAILAAFGAVLFTLATLRFRAWVAAARE